MAKPAKPSQKKTKAATPSSGDVYKDIGVKRRGRPSGYSEEIADRLCEAIAQGNALYILCECDGMPAERTVYQWLEKYPQFAQEYARARARQQDRCADEIIEIADKCIDPNKARLQVDARKWRMSKLAPKKYGDKLEIGGDPENPLKMLLSQLPTGSIKPVDESEDE